MEKPLRNLKVLLQLPGHLARGAPHQPPNSVAAWPPVPSATAKAGDRNMRGTRGVSLGSPVSLSPRSLVLDPGHSSKPPSAHWGPCLLLPKCSTRVPDTHTHTPTLFPVSEMRGREASTGPGPLWPVPATCLATPPGICQQGDGGMPDLGEFPPGGWPLPPTHSCFLPLQVGQAGSWLCRGLSQGGPRDWVGKDREWDRGAVVLCPWRPHVWWPSPEASAT